MRIQIHLDAASGTEQALERKQDAPVEVIEGTRSDGPTIAASICLLCEGVLRAVCSDRRCEGVRMCVIPLLY